jgi:hypothetical protein
MAQDGHFTEVQTTTEYTRNVCANSVGYFFARFQTSYRNCCLPMGLVASQDTGSVYGGAMTLLEGPNLLGFGFLQTCYGRRTILRSKSWTSAGRYDQAWSQSVNEL